MKWWPFSKKQKQPAAMSVEDLYQVIYGDGETSTGLYVNKKTAMQLSTVLQCVRVLCNGVSQVPFRLYRENGREKMPAREHPLYRLVSMAPNEWQTSFEFRTMVVMHLVLTGNAYVWVNRVQGEVMELLPYPPESVMTRQDGFATRYWITSSKGEQIEIPASEIWHIKQLPWDYSGGLDGVKTAREILGLTKATDTYGAKTFKNGGRPAGILSTPAVLDEKQREGLRADWEKMNSGINNANRTALVWGDLKFIPVAPNNDNSQFLETRKFQIEEVCRAFGVNPIKVFYSDKNSTYASVEQMNISHVSDTLMPLYANLEQGAWLKLLTRKEQAEGYYFKLEAKGLLRGTIKDRSEFYTKQFNVGALSPNDIRELEDMNPYEGGDYYFVPMNMTPPDEAANSDDEAANSDEKETYNNE